MFKKNILLSLGLLLVQAGANCMEPSARPKYKGIWDAMRRTSCSQVYGSSENADEERAEAIRLASSWDINVLSACGETPLHYAILCEQDTVVEALLARGADINLVDKLEERDALAYAKYLYTKDSMYYRGNKTALSNIIKMLEEVKAKQASARFGVSAGAYAGSGESVYTGADCGSSADVHAPTPIKKPVLPEPVVKLVSPTIVVPKIESVKTVSPVLSVSENTLRRRRQRKAAKIRQQAQVVKIEQVASKPEFETDDLGEVVVKSSAWCGCARRKSK